MKPSARLLLQSVIRNVVKNNLKWFGVIILIIDFCRVICTEKPNENNDSLQIILMEGLIRTYQSP